MGFYLGLMSGTSMDAIDAALATSSAASVTGAAGPRILGGVYRYA
jgi:1,6-anhydro-N-acetylmuramate kinase